MSILGQRDADQIRTQISTFVNAWETENTDLLDECVAEEPYVYFSTHWNCYTREQLKMQLKNAGKPKTVSRIFVANEVSRISGDKAAQYATVIGFFADSESHLAFGGTFSNKLEKQNGKWVYVEMRFELQTDDSAKNITLDGEGHVHTTPGNGDLEFISKWKKVDTRIGLFVDAIPGQGNHTIMPEFDAPWYLIPERDDVHSDEDEIEETLLRYFYAFDCNTPALFDGVFAEDLRFHSNQAGVLGMKDAVNYLTIVRQASARSFHAARITEIQVDGDSATVKAVRLSPEQVSVSAGCENAAAPCFEAGEYALAFAKNDGKWQICRFAYHVQ